VAWLNIRLAGKTLFRGEVGDVALERKDGTVQLSAPAPAAKKDEEVSNA